MRILLLTSVAGLLAASAAWAGKYDPEKLKACEFEIERMTIEEVSRQLRPEDIIAKYKLVTPILPPRLGKEQVEALIASEIAKAVEERFPLTRLQEIQRQANERFKLYKKNDPVTVQVRDVRSGRWIVGKWVVREITEKIVRLGDIDYIYDDIHQSEWCHFKKIEHDTAVESLINQQTAIFHKDRATFEAEQKRIMVPNIWQGQGYVYRRSKRAWVPREEVFAYLYQEAWKKKYIEVREAIVPRVMEENGFVWNEDVKRYELREAVAQPAAPGAEETAAPAAARPPALGEWKDKLEKLLRDGKGKQRAGDDIWSKDDEAGDDQPVEDKSGAKSGDKPPAAGTGAGAKPHAGEATSRKPSGGAEGAAPKANGTPKAEPPPPPAENPPTGGEKIKAATDQKQEALFGGD